jgi:hypothetical protein
MLNIGLLWSGFNMLLNCTARIVCAGAVCSPLRDSAAIYMQYAWHEWQARQTAWQARARWNVKPNLSACDSSTRHVRCFAESVATCTRAAHPTVMCECVLSQLIYPVRADVWLGVWAEVTKISCSRIGTCSTCSTVTSAEQVCGVPLDKTLA